MRKIFHVEDARVRSDVGNGEPVAARAREGFAAFVRDELVVEHLGLENVARRRNSADRLRARHQKLREREGVARIDERLAEHDEWMCFVVRVAVQTEEKT